MKPHVAVMVGVVAVLFAGGTAAVGVTVSTDDGDWLGSHGGTISAPWHDPDRARTPGGQQRDGRGQGWAMPGMMHGMTVASEYAYLAEMVAHHEEAVAAAEQLQRSERTEMREFGESIVDSQSAQIDRMNRWLADWYPNRTGREEYQPMMRDLSGLSGDRLDRVFLEDMIGHHMGAVMMSQQLLRLDVAEHPQVEALATTIRDDQHAEIFQMQQWMRDWFGQGWQRGGMHAGMNGDWMGPGMMY